MVTYWVMCVIIYKCRIVCGKSTFSIEFVWVLGLLCNRKTEEKSMDRRQKRSRKIICDTLLMLMKDKPIEEITIKELTDKADVNRKTFYNNYGSIMDVKRELEDNLVDLFFSLVDAENIEDKIVQADLNPGKFIHHLIKVINDDRAKAKMVLSSGEGTIALRHIHATLKPYIYTMSKEHNVSEAELEFSLHFIASGTVSILNAWLRDDIKATPLEMENLLTSLIKKVIR